MQRPVHHRSPRRLSRHRRSRRPLPHRLSPRDRQLLAALDAYQFLTAEQLCRLVFGGTASLSYCRDRLKRLYHAHQVDRLFLAHVPHGTPLTVYARHRRSSTRRSLFFLEHTLAVVDFILAVIDLCREGWLTLDRVVLEHELRRLPVRVGRGERTVAVVPDCYLRLVLAGTHELAWCVEVDRGSESGRLVREKVARYLAFAVGPYQRAFGTTALTVVIVTTAGARRLAHLIGAAEDELEASGRTDQADLFRLTSADLRREPAASLLLAERFWVPFQEQPVALIPDLEALR